MFVESSVAVVGALLASAISSPKVVLMADTKTTLNTGDSDTPEPSESQDPCDENIKLTINKVWKDLNNFDHSRPNSITVTISRTWKDKAGNETTEPVPGYESYLADLKLDSGAVNVIFSVVNQLVKALYLDKIQDSDLLKINLGIIKVDALYDGKLLHVNLLGLDISVGLSKKSTDNNQQTDLAIITIGDSSIKLPCDENGLLNDNDAKSNISVSLIKANRTKITDSNVYGVSQGYDVYAGGAGNNNDGDAKDGRSGGFVGFNDEGLLKNNNMYYCDVVRGTKDLVGPFSGKSELDTVYDFNSQEKVEGEKNNYRIYRKLDQSLDQIEKNNSILNSSHEKDDASGWDIYTIGHMNPVKTFETLKNAVLASKSDSVKADLNAYESPANATATVTVVAPSSRAVPFASFTKSRPLDNSS